MLLLHAALAVALQPGVSPSMPDLAAAQAASGIACGYASLSADERFMVGEVVLDTSTPMERKVAAGELVKQAVDRCPSDVASDDRRRRLAVAYAINQPIVEAADARLGGSATIAEIWASLDQSRRDMIRQVRERGSAMTADESRSLLDPILAAGVPRAVREVSAALGGLKAFEQVHSIQAGW